MKITLLSPDPWPVFHAIQAVAWDEVFKTSDKLPDNHQADWLISHNYRHILKEPIVSRFRGRAINLHASLLPWNRGASPNFWSWFDETPKGVSIHCIDRGIDTGEIVTQKEVNLSSSMTLRQTYDVLQGELISAFRTCWRDIRHGHLSLQARSGVGSYHNSAGTKYWTDQLPSGWDTCVEVPTRWGKQARQTKDDAEAQMTGEFFDKMDDDLRS